MIAGDENSNSKPAAVPFDSKSTRLLSSFAKPVKDLTAMEFMQEENKQMKRKFTELKKENEKLNNKNHELVKQIRDLQKKMYTRNESKKYAIDAPRISTQVAPERMKT